MTLMLGLSESSTITFSVVGFFAFLVLVVLVRSLLLRSKVAWRKLRVGFFIEREDAGTGDDDLSA